MISKATDNLSKAGWSWGCISAVDSNGRTIFVVDAHRGDEKGSSLLLLFVGQQEEQPV
jgi:hypothetical protein